MSNLFRDNAYNLLGLDTSASQREINKRSKEITNLLRIDEAVVYDTDLDITNPNRTEERVKDAVQRLSSPTKRIQEYFFWFDIESDEDEKAVQSLQEGRIDEAINIWSQDAERESAKGFVAKKNIAITTSLLLIEKGHKKYLTQSIGAWRDIVQSDKFWNHFDKIYSLNDEVGTSSAALKDFRDKVADLLSDFYTEVSQSNGDNTFYSLFAKVFGAKGQKLQQDVLSPIYEAINEASVKLKNLNISEDNIISDEEVAELRRLTRILQTNFDKLKELGLYSDSQSKTMRDKAAEALRTVALDIYNNLGESAKPIALLNLASKIAGTTNTLTRINRDVEQLRKNRADEKIIKPINELVEEESYEEALDLILDAQEKHKNNKDLQGFLSARLKWCVAGVAVAQFKEGQNLFEKKRFSEAKDLLSSNVEFILSYLEDTNISREYVDGILAEINRITNTVGSQTAGQSMEALRNRVIEQTEIHFKDDFEGTILVMIADSAIYANLAEKIPPLKRKQTVKRWAWYAVGAVVLLIIIGSSSSDSTSTGSTGTTSSGSSSNSAWQTCSDEYDNLKSQLDSVESSMQSYKDAGDTDSYNALVPQQNDLVGQVNSKANECNGLR